MKRDRLNTTSRVKRAASHFLVYFFCLLVAVTAFFPFFTMLVSSTWDNYNIVTNLNVVPGPYFVRNYERLTQNINIWRGFANSIFLAVTGTLVTVYFSALTAYAFSKFNFKGRNFLFGVVLVAMMLPGQIGVIGFYREISNMKLLDTYWPLILPSIANCGCVFFFKQYLDGGLPNELIEATYADGCPELKIFHVIVLPVMFPALVTQGVMSFIGSWNSYMTPLILLRTADKLTLPLMVSNVRDSMHADYGALYVGMLITVIPMVIIFCMSSKVIMEKISIGAAVKG